MRLRARRACHVHDRALDLEVDFDRGEELRTEISAKFTRDAPGGRLRGLPGSSSPSGSPTIGGLFALVARAQPV